MIIDSSGNLGLGVTPSAWGSSYKALEVGGVVSYFSSANQYFGMYANAYRNSGGSLIYTTTGVSSGYLQDLGAHKWFSAASGTAGNAITFTQAMTLDASGNWLLGTTTARSRITALGTTTSSPTLGTASGTALFCPNDNAYGTMFGSSANGDGWIQQQRVDGTATAYNLLLQPSGGNLLVGTTSGSSKLTVEGASGNSTLVSIYNTSNSSGNQNLVLSLGANANNTSSYFLVCQTPAVANRLFIYGNGNVVNTNNSYGSLSDVKLKENIVDASPKLADLMQVQVRNYNLIGSTTKQIGVVAQELETVFPSMIDVSPDIDAEGNDLGTTTKSVKYSVFVPMLIKALQELKAEFDAYKASHP